jgi:hypothetical protein
MRKMKLSVPVYFAIALYFSGCGFFGVSNNTGYNSIDSRTILRDITFLASDSLKGRPTPSREQDTAAAYIVNCFKQSNLKPVNGSYYQEVNLGKVRLATDNYLKISKDAKEVSFKIKDEFIPFEMTANNQFSGKVVFAGYGITAPEYEYDDYQNIDVKGKIVFVLRHEPGEEDTASLFDGNKATDYSEVKEKVKIAIEHGASAVMVATDPLNHSFLIPRGFPWPSLSKIIPKDALPISLLDEEKDKIPVIHVGEEVIKLLFGSVSKLRDIQEEIDKNVKPNSFELEGYTTSIKTSTEIEKAPAKNVVGYVEGSDLVLKNEIIVVGAHYDHVGPKKKEKPTDDIINNGADDNASGTVTILALAKAFGTLEVKPKRSVLFIAFAGEELGLLGSSAYVNNPLFPLDKTVAMLNYDMVGRNTIDSLYLVGGTRSPDLKQIAVEENEKVGFKLGYEYENFIGRSDQASFLNKKIPILYLTSGEHPDYHKVTDEVWLINPEKIEKISQLSFYIINRIANESRYYKVIPKKISLI